MELRSCIARPWMAVRSRNGLVMKGLALAEAHEASGWINAAAA